MNKEPIKIPLGNDVFALIDAEDQERASGWKWHLTTLNGVKSVKGRPKSDPYCGPTAMARVILGLDSKQRFIFRDGDRLNNTRDNLMIATVSQLRASSGRKRENQSGVKGVVFDKTACQRKWRAYIVVNYKQIGLGHHATLEEAIAARKSAEEKYFGEFSSKQDRGECDPNLPQVLNVTWFPPEEIHKLSEINEETRFATCSICGPNTRIYGPAGYWKCNVVHKKSHFKHRKKRNKQRDFSRRPYMAFKKDHCERCPFVAVHPCQLDVHHKDYDSRNNDPSNLETICANCHRLETQTMRDNLFLGTNGVNRWVGSRCSHGIKKGGGSSNTSGFVGVSRHTASGKWLAFIGVNGQHIHLGTFAEKEDAIAARKEAEQFYFNRPMNESP